MESCSFSKLVRYLDKKLDLDGRLEVLNHLDRCEICRDAIYHISRDRDQAYFVNCRQRAEERVA
ncbi:MAG TPA: zf-HC2 domain-containing protein [Acidobacteriota bacterium]|nr:zf-HC2 domain-containing protein [Acidobacteriota bacterium]